MGGRAESGAPHHFQLGEWTVQPTLNRLSRGAEVVRVEPKMMDVLVLLARSAGTVVPKDDIGDAVWPDVFISESVITRAIAGLRRALGDDARDPRFIETIPKRGYRLVASLTAIPATSDVGPTAGPAEPTPAPRREMPQAGSRYTVGQWVRGANFYGRSRELHEALEGPRNWLWILGNRAVGKTSMLKQLEHLAATESPPRYFPLFWDLQGTESVEELHADFAALLEEREEELGARGVELEEIRASDLFVALRRLRRALRSRGLTLLLLCDEVEELIQLDERSPTLLSKLRRALQSAESIRTVMASTAKLWELASQRGDTSPFLHGFAPPLYLGALSDDASKGVIRRDQADADPAVDEAAADAIARLAGNHPYLLQLVGSHFAETSELADAVDLALADPSLDFFFRVDFDLLSVSERSLLAAVAGGTPGREDLPAAESLHLERLGMIERPADGAPRVRSEILRRWLGDRPA